MTKSKAKQGMPEICMNCKFAKIPEYGDYIFMVNTQVKCTITGKVHNWEYSCKKWEEIE